MKNLVFTGVLSAVCLATSACGDKGGNSAANESSANLAATGGEEAVPGDESAATGTNASGANVSADAFPADARIVEENGVTYRIGPDGARVRLGPNDSRIVVDNGVRYRVDPGGARVRIDEKGIRIPGVDIDMPDVDAGINNKGNLDIDVKDKKDGDKGPN